MRARSISRARTARTTIRALEGQIDRNFQQAGLDLRYLEQLRGSPQSPQTANEIAQTNARLQEYTRDNMAVAERIRSAAAPFGLNCLPGDYACSRQLYQRLAQFIDTAEAQQSQYPAFLQQVAAHQTNLTALRCGEAAAAVTAGAAIPEAGVLSGSWRSSYGNVTISISQNGREVSARTSEGYSYRSLFDGGDRIILTWTQNGSPGSDTGRISYDGNGRAVLIDFGGGISWQRQ
jgi:hypothetical protein